MDRSCCELHFDCFTNSIILQIHEFGADTLNAEIGGLYPTSCFEFRVAALKDGVESKPSESVTCDTQVAGCGPKADKKTCKIM